MKKIGTLVSLLFISVLLTDCTTKKAASTTASPEQKVADIKKNFTQAQLDEGKTLWQGSCDNCHKLFAPDTRTVEKWENILPRMSKRSKLNDQQAAMVRAYILSHAKLS